MDQKNPDSGDATVVKAKAKMDLGIKVTRADGRVERYRVNPDGSLKPEKEPANG